jgi:hypothetical protein
LGDDVAAMGVGWLGVGWTGVTAVMMHADCTIAAARKIIRTLRKVVFMVSSSGDKDQYLIVIVADQGHLVKTAVPI